MEKLVEKSTRQYEVIQENLDQMVILLREGQTNALGQLQQEWHARMETCRDTDAQINSRMIDFWPSPEILEAMEYRHRLMLQVRQKCQMLLQQARTLQAVTAEELLRLKQGRKALGGYRSSNGGNAHSTLGSY
jgi:hypothetical protein